MDYEKKYKEALERARDVYTYYCDDREQLRKIESIFPELKESSQEGSKVLTNSKDLWRGVPGAIFIWHGEWADPEILYEGHLLSSSDVEDSLWVSYQSDLSEGEIAPNMSFDEWCKKQGTDYLADTLDEFIAMTNE